MDAQENLKTYPPDEPDVVHVTGSEAAAPDTARPGGPLGNVEAKFAAIVEHSDQGYAELDLEGRITFVNGRLADMLGYRPDELIGRRAADLLAEADQARAESAFHEAFTGAVQGPRCYTAQAKDGRPKPISVKSIVLRKDTAVVQVLYLVVDDSERQQALERLRESESRYRLIAGNVTDVIWTVGPENPEDLTQRLATADLTELAKEMLDRWRIGFVSPLVERLLGYSVSEIQGRPPGWALTPAAYQTAHAVIMDELARERGGELDLQRQQTMELELRTRDGSVRWVEVNAKLLRSEQGEIIGAVGVSRDATRRKAVELALRQSEAKFRVISDAALDAVAMIDAQGKIIHWNPAAERIFGFRAEEVLGHPVHSVVTPEPYRDAAERGLLEFMRTGQGPAIGRLLELSARRRDGTELPIEISIAPIQVDGAWHAVAIVRDITERKRAREELLREQDPLRQLLEVYDRHRLLAACEAHDGIAQPLAAVLMSLESSTDELRSHPSSKKLDDAVRLLRETFDATRRLMNGLGPPILEELGVVAAIEHLAAEKQAQEQVEIQYFHDVKFERLAPPLETAVFRIVEESLANALRHSGSPTVRIDLVQADPFIRVSVKDQGRGFDPEQVDQKFFGLRGIRERARLFGGSATVHAAPGQGVEIVAELPLLGADQA